MNTAKEYSELEKDIEEIIRILNEAGYLQGKMIWQAVGQAGLGALGMGLAVWGWLAVSQSLSNWARVPLAVAIGGAIYACIMLALRVPETSSLMRVLLNRMKLAFRRG